MGGGTYDRAVYASFSASINGSSRDEVFHSKTIQSRMDPKKIEFRESRDSEEHPNSTPIALFFDVTGSMGNIPHRFIQNGLGTLMEHLLENSPVSDPQLLFGAIGDARYDNHPLQVSQFESDNRMVDQLKEVYIEGGGGGNRTESYDLAWYFCAYHTEIDSFEKRGKKGYCFTLGDERFPESIPYSELVNIVGSDNIQTKDLDSVDLLAAARKKWNCFHLMIESGNGYRMDRMMVKQTWAEHMGKYVLRVRDTDHIPYIISAAIRLNEGEDLDVVLGDIGDAAILEGVKYSISSEE